MNTRKLLALVFAVVMVIGLFTACQTTSPTASSAAPATSAAGSATAAPSSDAATVAPTTEPLKPIKVSLDVMEAEKCGTNAKSDFIKEKFGITFDYIPVDWGTWNEKIKTWVNANDAPDLVWWDLKGASSQDYKTWAKDGAFKEIDLANVAKYPVLKQQSETMASIDALKVDGKLYAWPATRNNPAVAQNTYMSHWNYRRDWAKAVGLYKEGDVYTYEEWTALCKAVITQDPGKNGAGNTAALVMDSWAFPHAAVLFIGPVLAEGNETCSYIKDASGKYVWPPTLPEYKDGVLKTYDMYQQGIIWKDNIQFKGTEPKDMMLAGRAFAKYNGGEIDFNDWTFTMLKNKVISQESDYGPAIITFDGKFYLTQTEDYWTVTAFSNKVDDEKMNRVLSMWDFLQSKDGLLFQWLGIEGKDFNKKADGTVDILWQKDASTGRWVNPYSEIRTNEFNPSGQTGPGNPSYPTYGASQDKEVWDYMAKNPTEIKPFDYKVSFLSAPNKDTYGSFGADVKAKLIELLQNSKDIGADWDAFVASMMPKVQPILDEINTGVK